MLSRLISAAMANRLVVCGLLLALISYGIFCVYQIPIEAFPDLTNNQVTVFTESPGMPPGEVERLVSFPIETGMLGLPRTTGLRSVSKFGLSIVTVVFEDDVNVFLARQWVNERLQEVKQRIPGNLSPTVGPLATVFGEVFQYTLEGGNLTALEKKTFHEWVLKPQIRTVKGINDVDTWGGLTEQLEVEVDPLALEKYGLTLADVSHALGASNQNFGAGYMEHASEQYNVVGIGRVADAADLAKIVLKAQAGTPVLVGDVAEIKHGARQRQGTIQRGGKGETIGGVAVMLKGENGREVIARVKERLAQIPLPPGMKLEPFYDQSEVINRTIGTVSENLLIAGGLVILVLLLFLGNVRAALLVALTIPLSLLVGFIGMRWFGISANLMSLGAVDFGMIVDGAVVMVEHAVWRMSRQPNAARKGLLESAASEVARPIIFAVGIIVAVYLPIFFLEGLEGRLFRPMAITVCSALIGSLVLALFAMPVLGSFVLRPSAHSETRWFTALQNGYRALLQGVLGHRKFWLAVGAGLSAAALASLFMIGTEFMPKLEEGSILIQTKKLPGISVTESAKLGEQVEQVVLQFPEVTGVVTKTGRSDLALDAMGVYEGDVYIQLKPVSEWTSARTKEELIEKLAEKLAVVPGVGLNFTMPMAMRMDEVISGVKADVALKIFGDDPQKLEALAERALRAMEATQGVADSAMEVASGSAELHVTMKPDALARFGLRVEDVREVVQSAVEGQPVTEVLDGRRRVQVVMRLPEQYRSEPSALETIRLTAPAGERVLLRQVAEVKVVRGPELIQRENGQRRIVVQCNVRGRDLGSFVEEAQARVNKAVSLPAGYRFEWGGQFENQSRATGRLALILPLSLVLVLSLLYFTFHSMPQALLIVANVPFALVGGVAALWLRGMNLNLSASIGFIALFGVAVLNGIVMVDRINQLVREGLAVEVAIREGAASRLRPVLMTALVASLGFLPMALSHAAGSEVQRPLATVVIGGLVSATVLTLFLLPVMYSWFAPPKPDMATVAADDSSN